MPPLTWLNKESQDYVDVRDNYHEQAAGPVLAKEFKDTKVSTNIGTELELKLNTMKDQTTQKNEGSGVNNTNIISTSGYNSKLRYSEEYGGSII